LVNLLSGGKPVNSAVKFSNFFLIVDGSLNSNQNVMQCFRTFMAHLKSKFSIGKGGDSAFKILPDGSYFNAYPSIIESFSKIEESITVSGANDVRPATASNDSVRNASRLSANSKRDKEPTAKGKAAKEVAAEVASVANSTESLPIFKSSAFSIGIACDAENLFNKDPKDANKYDVEGQKV